MKFVTVLAAAAGAVANAYHMQEEEVAQGYDVGVTFPGRPMLPSLAELTDEVLGEAYDAWRKFFKAHEGEVVQSERDIRLKIFRENIAYMHEMNGKQNDFEMGFGPFSDLSASEFAAMNGFGKNPTGLKDGYQSCDKKHQNSGKTLPKAFDWTSTSVNGGHAGVVTGIKNQGQCGSCWSFAATGSLEGQMALATGKPAVPISEQQFVDCDKVDNGCGGGLPDTAFEWAEQTGLASESSYSYVSGGGRTEQCKLSTIKQSDIVIPDGGVQGCTDVQAGSEEDLMDAVVTVGPIAVGVDASCFQHYFRGVITSNWCDGRLNHGVLVVGYGHRTGIPVVWPTTDYWKIKNSWGHLWGEWGYVRVARGSKHTHNNMGRCGVLTAPAYPNLKVANDQRTWLNQNDDMWL